jgi:hypothetical protein
MNPQTHATVAIKISSPLALVRYVTRVEKLMSEMRTVAQIQAFVSGIHRSINTGTARTVAAIRTFRSLANVAMSLLE